MTEDQKEIILRSVKELTEEREQKKLAPFCPLLIALWQRINESSVMRLPELKECLNELHLARIVFVGHTINNHYIKLLN